MIALCDIFPQLQHFDDISINLIARSGFDSNQKGNIMSILMSIDPAFTFLKTPAEALDRLTSDETFPLVYGSVSSFQGTHDQKVLNQMFFIMAYLIANRLLDHKQVCVSIENLISSDQQLGFSIFWNISSAVVHTQALICTILDSYCRCYGVDPYMRTPVYLRTYPKEHFHLLSAADRRTLSGHLGQAILFIAIRERHAEAIQFLLDRGVQVNGIGDKKEDHNPYPHIPLLTPLTNAIRHGSHEVIRMIITCAMETTEAGGSKKDIETAFHAAISINNVVACKILLEAGFKVSGNSGLLDKVRNLSLELYQMMRENATTRDRAICDIIEAAEGGLENLSTFLWAHDYLTKDEILEEALYVSIERCNETSTRILLRRGVDANAIKYLKRDDDWLDKAKSSRAEVGDCLHAEVEKHSPLVRAIEMGTRQCIYLLVKSGALLDVFELQRVLVNQRVDMDICMILHRSGYNMTSFGADILEGCSGEQEILWLDFFLSAGMSVDAFTEGEWSILQIMVIRGNLCGVQMLLDQGANVNQPAAENGGRTALQAAAEEENEAMIDLLLDAGADITAPPAKEHGLTVLEALMSKMSLEGPIRLFTKLLKKGAPVNRSNGRLLHNLIQFGNGELVAVALRSGARTDERASVDGPLAPPQAMLTPLQYAAYCSKTGIIQLLLENGAEINAPASGQQGATALQAAILSKASYGRHDMINLFLNAQADVNAPPSPDVGRTALQAAASLNPPELALVQLLIDRQADVNAKPAKIGGITAIQAAAIAGYMQVVLLLLKHHADVDAPAAPEEGRTAIEGAAEHGRLEIVRLLLTKARFPLPDGFKKAIALAKKNLHWAIVDLLQHAQNCFNPLTLSYNEDMVV